MKRILLLLYQYFVYLPIGLVLTIFSAAFTVFLCLFFDTKVSSIFLRYCWARPMVYLLFCRVKVVGTNHLNKKQSVIFVANHQGAFDIFLLYGWLKSDFCWIMKKELMNIPVVGYACKKVGHIAIDRKNKRNALYSIIEAKQRLTGGTSVVFFPEGTRSPSGHMRAFKNGAFHLAKELNIPIVPLTINGVYRVEQAGILQPFKKLELVIHSPIPSTEVSHLDTEALNQLSYATVKQTLKL